MPHSSSGDNSVLERVYTSLDLVDGMLLGATAAPCDDVTKEEWRAVGDWLLLAKRVHAERMFFVDDDPVLVFSTLPAGATQAQIVDLYRRTWCLARPRCLFLAIGENLHVYALTDPPSRHEAAGFVEPLQVLGRAANVAEALSEFRRDRLESGAAFEAPTFSSHDRRADQQLLRDVGAATEALIRGGLSRRTAHTLIERAILVRYLEDRDVLVPGYFDEVAAPRAAWQELLAAHQTLTMGPDSRFLTCLQDRTLTAALFSRLANDFNGDLFADREQELAQVSGEQLLLLRDMLLGAVNASQDQLFLWAYDFSVVPTSLISTMYELFHHQEIDGQATSTYYTPPQLVEFMVAGLLTEKMMNTEPRVCDPACGSGVFLVEAYRRLVRHEMASSGHRLTSRRLRDLLLTRVVGVDTDEAAIRLAAFSLYLALLNYQSPTDIRRAGPLPPLISDRTPTAQTRPLTVGDAFSVVPPNAAGGAAPGFHWSTGGFDVVVANPPWTEPAGGPRTIAEDWAEERGLPTGDRGPSSLFLWRALDLLTDDGVAALLVGAKSLLNTRVTAQTFRRRFLEAVRLDHVVSFIDVRGEFFKGARAPFTLLRFGRRTQDDRDHVVVYEAARRTVGQPGSVSFLRLDRRLVQQSSLYTHDFLWKTYAVGGHRDEALVLRLSAESSLGELENPDAPSRFGWQRPTGGGRPQPPSDRLREIPSVSRITAWGPSSDWPRITLPKKVKREPHAAVFEGRRLVIGMGVVRLDVASRIGLQARVVSESLAFPHSILGFPMGHRPAWQADVALGVLLSSVGRYWLAMVSGAWGVWRDQVRKEQLMRLPMRLTRASDPAVRRIQAAVRELPRAGPTPAPATSLWNDSEITLADLDSIFNALDEAVADLFTLSGGERDLVADFWNVGLPQATSPVGDDIARYVDAFLAIWNTQLGEDGDFGWQMHSDPGSRITALVFETRVRGETPPPEAATVANLGWSEVLRRIGIGLTHERSASLRSHGMLRVVTDTAIVIVKRDEQRLWTRSAARDDAEATTVQAMTLERA
jgi:hypothetical protein